MSFDSLPAAGCLIAADIDKTLLEQGTADERLRFLRDVGPLLAKAARLGANLAFITGNSMEELATRFLPMLLDALGQTEETSLIGRCHFFCCSGGIYATIDPTRPDAGINWIEGAGAATRIAPRFVDPTYAQSCALEPAELTRVEALVRAVADEYSIRLADEESALAVDYKLDRVKTGGKLVRPRIERRGATASDGVFYTAQVTLKPVLSYRSARDGLDKKGVDPRGDVVQEIRRRLNAAGLRHLAVTGGGTTSVDVTLGRVDKEYALWSLIHRLKLGGATWLGEPVGENTIYFGDEVIPDGNDYPVTRIPGVLVLAVNSDKGRVPPETEILIADGLFVGPQATARVLVEFNQLAEGLMGASSPIAALREKLWLDRIGEKLRQLKARPGRSDAIRALHAVATLAAREDERSQQLVSFLVDQLDALTRGFAVESLPEAFGASRPADD